MRKTWLLSAAIGALYGPGTGGVRDRGTERGAVLPGNGCEGPDLQGVDGGAAIHTLAYDLNGSTDLKTSPVAANKLVNNMVILGILQEITGKERYQMFAFVDFIRIIEKGTRV